MTKLITPLCLAACLALAAPATAAVQTFGPDFSKFTIDVPDGWTAKPQDGGCQLISPDQNSSFSVQVQKNGGKSASELIKLIGNQLGGKILLSKDMNPNQSIMEVELNGVKLKLMVMVEGDKFLTVTMAGSDEDTMTKIMDTVKEAK